MKIIDRSYGSIPHLSTSKLNQQADKKITAGQELILTKKARDWKDTIIVTEKIDGSNVGVIMKDGQLFPLTRSGYHAKSSPYVQHHAFAAFVECQDMFDWLPDGWRVCGEWCIMAHGTLYDIRMEPPFVAFDIFNEQNKRLPYMSFVECCAGQGIPMVPMVHIGQPISIDNAMKLVGKGHYGHPDKPEGCVYRVERDGTVDFLAKWVRSDKQDGQYLDVDTWNTGADFWLPSVEPLKQNA